MTSRPQWVLAASLLLATPLSAQDLETVVDAVIQQPDWSVVSDLSRYSDQNLESLAGDRSEEVRDYGFRGASAFDLAVLADPGANIVSVTLYEMIDSTAAYGLFAMERDYTDPAFETELLGAESYRQGDALVFWQSRYVGRLAGPRAGTVAVAEFMTGQLSNLSRKAPVSFHLPPDDLIPASERYILTASALRAEADLGLDGLGFENSVEAALADYRNGTGVVRLALLMYPTPQLASLQAETWLLTLDEADAPPSRRLGPLLGIVTESTSPALADAVLSNLVYQTETTWNAPPEDPLTVPELILSIFMWIGVALLFTLIVGIGFGGFRIYMKARHPSRYFPSEEDTQFVQLNINQPVTPKELGH